MTAHKDTIAFNWTFEEYDHKEKDIRWIIGFAVVVIAGALLAILARNTLLAGVIIIGGGLLFYLARRPARDIHIEISERGILYGDDMYKYQNLDHFWISEPDEHGHTTLLLAINRTFLPIVSIPLPDNVDTLEVYDYVSEFLDEQEIQEPWVFKLVDHLGL